MTLLQAETALAAVAADLTAAAPGGWQRTSEFAILPLGDVLLFPPMDPFIKAAAWLLTVVVGLVLLLACTNLASFLLARALDRRRDVAVRLALGASRGSLVRRLLTETTLLSLLAGLVGVGLAVGLLSLLQNAELPLPVPVELDLSLDWIVLAFTLGASVVAGSRLGLVPALQSTRPDLASTLKSETAGGGQPGQLRWRNALSVTQLTVSLVLDDADRSDARELPEALEQALGVKTALVVREAGGRHHKRHEGGRLAAEPGVDGLHLLEAAEEKTRTDQQHQRHRQLRDEDGDAVGRMLRRLGDDARDLLVVGVASDARVRSLGGAPELMIYQPYSQVYSPFLTVVARTTVDPERTALALMNAGREVDPDLWVWETKTMDQHLGIMLLPAQLSAFLLSVFAALALLLSSIGLYGVVSSAVAQRTREVGIGMALGADADRVVRLLAASGLKLVLVGLLSDLLFGVETFDLMIFVAVPVVLGLTAVVAAYGHRPRRVARAGAAAERPVVRRGDLRPDDLRGGSGRPRSDSGGRRLPAGTPCRAAQSGDGASRRVVALPLRRRALAARGESPAAFGWRCIRPNCVVCRSKTAGMLPRHALHGPAAASI